MVPRGQQSGISQDLPHVGVPPLTRIVGSPFTVLDFGVYERLLENVWSDSLRANHLQSQLTSLGFPAHDLVAVTGVASIVRASAEVEDTGTDAMEAKIGERTQ